MEDELNNDRDLLERLRKGNTACFEILYSKYSGKLYNYILRISNGDFYLAEEIVQNVFVKIWEIHTNINTEGSFNSFVYTVGRNMFLNVVKSRMQEYLYQDYVIEHENTFEDSAEKEVEYKMLEEQINKLIEQLPAARRKIYIMSKIKNFSNREIATLLEISENTVESQLNKANKFMRRSLLPYTGMMFIGAFLPFL
ncbi:MAG: RNA polymerase sigma-70 factor [Bacteroidales bacterium]|nr:RNA polymerase sigma-70 factor [Bacteroidales bacterium]